MVLVISQKIQTPKLKKFNKPGAVAQNHNARARQAPEDGPNKSMSSRSTTFGFGNFFIGVRSNNLKDWISKYLNSKQNFGTINDFKWNNHQLQSYKSLSFLHLSLFKQFKKFEIQKMHENFKQNFGTVDFKWNRHQLQSCNVNEIYYFCFGHFSIWVCSNKLKI